MIAYTNPILPRFVIGLLALLTVSTVTAQTIISVNINENQGRRAMAPGDLAGANSDVRVANWTDVDVGTSSLAGDSIVYNDGTAVGGEFSIDFDLTNTFLGVTTLTNDAQMYAGKATATQNSGVDTVTLNNIPFAQYDIYYYGTGQNSAGGRGGLAAVDDVAFGESGFDGEVFYIRNGSSANADGTGYVVATTTSYDSGEPTNVASANYAYFGGLSGDTQVISMQAIEMGDGTNFRFDISGFQIVQVPEPRFYAAALGLAVVALTIASRRRRG